MEMKSAIHADRVKLYHNPELRPTNTEHEDGENDGETDSENEQSSEDENDAQQDDARGRQDDDATQSKNQQNNTQNAQIHKGTQNDAPDAQVDADDASDSESDTDASNEESDDEPIYMVEKYQDTNTKRGVKHYRVNRAGFSARHDSWEPGRNFPKELIQNYNSRVEKQRKR